MSELFKQSNVEARPDSGYFTPDCLTMIKRVFDATCAGGKILDKSRRDDLASKLMHASKTIPDVAALTEYARKAINGS